MKKYILLSVLAAGVLVLGGCSLSGSNNSQQSNPSAGSNTSSPTVSNPQTPVVSDQGSPAQEITASVSIQNFAFNPGTLTIKKGATVTWTNNDSVVHQIKSATFNSSQLSTGQTFSFTFNDAGTFDYSCAIHPSMHGVVVVQ